MAEAPFGEVRWREPIFLSSGDFAEEDADFTERLPTKLWNLPIQDWWGPRELPMPRRRVTHTFADNEVVIIVGRSTACSSKAWNSLSVFAHKIEPTAKQLFEDIFNAWELPTLTTRSDDEGADSVEIQLDRLERCCGTEIAKAIGDELKQQIENADEEDGTIPVPALIRLVDFLCAHPRVKPPFVFISCQTIKVQWQPSSGEIAWIEFDATERVRLLAFCPDPKAAGGIRRLVANSTIQKAYRDLLGFGADWIIR